MEVPLFWRVTWCTVWLSFMFGPWAVNSAPISIDFNSCQPAVYPTSPDPNAPTQIVQCCPLKTTRPIIDGAPPPSTSYTRVRLASQCTDAAYTEKLNKAYELMRALPDDDPRSFKQQWSLHCSYCGGSFLTFNSSGIPEGIDIHFSWLFYPWHRWYLFFHERILQSLLGDPTFSLTYWNWDGPYSVGDGSSKDGACLAQGDNFPSPFSNPFSAAYDVNRSENAKGNGRLHFPDLTFQPTLPAAQQPLYNATEEQLIQSNLAVMYNALVSGGTTAETFMGRPYRAGDTRGNPNPTTGGAGTLEATAHGGVHFWTGEDPPKNIDMGVLTWSARDPVFFAHHSNIDRLLSVWKDIGPILGQNREYYSDPDFLNAEFLFYDENKDLRRVKVGDALDTRKLGYVYQQSNIEPWLHINQTRCSKLTYLELLAQAQSLPAPTTDSSGYYYLQAGTPFVIIIDRPENPHGLEEFLTIDGIKLDRSQNAGFDVFVDLLDPSSYSNPWTCAEYSGRFINMANGRRIPGKETLAWKTSITQTLADIQPPEAPSKLAITLVPLSPPGGYETIKFKCITVDTSST